MRSFLVVVVAVLNAIALGQQLPKSMTKLSVRLQSPEVPDESFAAKPKLMYRAGNRYCRTEEQPDPERGIHGLMIINEPDAWMVDLASKTAKHLIDPGPTFNCHLAVFAPGNGRSTIDPKDPLIELEFGRELAYFKDKGAESKEGAVIRGKPTTAYTVAVGDSRLFLFTTGTPERPWALVRQHGNIRDIYWYGEFEQVPFDSKLFAKPDGVRIEEIK